LQPSCKSQELKKKKEGKELESYLGLAPNTRRDNMVATSGRDSG